MEGLLSPKLGSTIKTLPTQEKHFTKFTSGAIAWRRSIRLSSRVVKKCKTPLEGGTSLIGLVVSSTVLFLRFSIPALRTASSAPVPFTCLLYTSDAADER